MFPPQAAAVLPPLPEPMLSPLPSEGLMLGAVLAWLAGCVLASLLVWAYQHTLQAALRSLWLACASAAALQPSMPIGHSMPPSWAALGLLLAIGCSTAFWARTLGLSAHSARQQNLQRAGLAAYLPAAALGAWVTGSAIQGLLLWHLVQLVWWAQALRQQRQRGHLQTLRLGLTPLLLIVATALQHIAQLAELSATPTLTALWQGVMICSVSHVALDAVISVPRTLRQTLTDHDWQQALLLRYQEAASQRLAEHTADLRRALSHAEHTETRQRNLLTHVAHSLREPADQMAKALAALRGARTAPPAPELLDSLGAATDKVQVLCIQLQDHERWRTRGLAPQFSALDLQVWLPGLLARQPNSSGLTLAAPATPLVIEADAVLLDIAVRQLLQGAYGPLHRPLKLQLSRGGGLAVLTIDSDTLSIPPSLRARAFDRQLCLTGDPQQGTGLGLARAIALLHDGDVSLAGVQGGGTRFCLSIPLAPEVCHQPISLQGAPTEPGACSINGNT